MNVPITNPYDKNKPTTPLWGESPINMLKQLPKQYTGPASKQNVTNQCGTALKTGCNTFKAYTSGGYYWDYYTGPRLNIKTVLSTYGDFHVKDKTAVRTSYL